jgi:tetratricopeptide (TPR) repeat protein
MVACTWCAYLEAVPEYSGLADSSFKEASTVRAPQYAVAHHWYSIYLTSMRRNPEAIREIKRALELDPLSSSINANAGVTYMAAGDYDRAEQQLQSAIELDPRGPMPFGYLGKLYEREAKYYTIALSKHSKKPKSLKQRRTLTSIQLWLSTHAAEEAWKLGGLCGS